MARATCARTSTWTWCSRSSGSKCSLDCKGTDCMDSELLCLYGFSYQVEPADCTVNSDAGQIMTNTYCPKWRSAYSL